MAESVSFLCDGCSERIEDGECPIVIRVTVGVAPMHPSVAKGEPLDVTEMPLTPLTRQLLAKPIARGEWCDACFAAAFGLPRTVPPPAPEVSGQPPAESPSSGGADAGAPAIVSPPLPGADHA